MIDLGRAVRDCRERRGFTLTELSDRSGVSPAMLSSIERNQKNPTIQVAYRIAVALEEPLTSLLGSTSPVRLETIRKGDHQVCIDDRTGVRWTELAPQLVRRGIEVLRYEMPVGVEYDGFPADRVGVMKFGMVSRGRIRVRVGEERVELGPGDSLTAVTDIPHGISNIGDGVAEIILVVDRSLAGVAPERIEGAEAKPHAVAPA